MLESVARSLFSTEQLNIMFNNTGLEPKWTVRNELGLFISGRSRKFRKGCLAVYKNHFIGKKKRKP